MKELQLIRDHVTSDGVFGSLLIPETIYPGLRLCTAEDDWLDNAPGKSCIPAGSYTIHRTIWQKYKIETFQVLDVPGRDRILLHDGNTEEDVEGCILLGLHFGKLLVARDEDTGATNVLKEGVTSSRIAFHEFMDAMRGVDQAYLEIAWAPGVLA